jgi:hypothetical protein
MVAPVNVPRPHALKPGDFGGFFLIRGAFEMSQIGSRGAQDALKLKTRHHVRKFCVVVCFILGRIEGFKTGRKDHGTHIQRNLFFFLLEEYSVCGAKLFAGPAFPFLEIDAVVSVQDIFKGYGLGVGYIDGFSLDKVCIVFIFHLFRALFKACPAGDAFLHIHITRALEDLHFKITLFSLDVQDFRECE